MVYDANFIRQMIREKEAQSKLNKIFTVADFQMSEQRTKEPKTREHFMVVCLFEEVMKSPRKFKEIENDFIKSLAANFTNDPEHKLSPKQIDWLEVLWTK